MSTARNRASPHSAGSLHLILHAPSSHAATTLQRPGQQKGLRTLLFSIHFRNIVFALGLLLNVSFKTQIGSCGYLGLSIRMYRLLNQCLALAEKFRGEALLKQLWDKNLFTRCENPTCTVPLFTSLCIYRYLKQGRIHLLIGSLQFRTEKR